MCDDDFAVAYPIYSAEPSTIEHLQFFNIAPTPSDGIKATSLGEGGFCSGSAFAKCARALSRRD